MHAWQWRLCCSRGLMGVQVGCDVSTMSSAAVLLMEASLLRGPQVNGAAGST
jgi:hypothetical protein